MNEESSQVTERDKELERWEQVRQIRRIEDEAVHAGYGRMFESVITVGQGASKAILFLCGGGAAAMLALLGQVFSSPQSALAPLQQELAEALFWFVSGAATATITAGVTYVTQSFFCDGALKMARQYLDRPWPGEERPATPNKTSRSTLIGHVSNGIGIALWLASLALFLYGCHIAKSIISKAVLFV